MQPVLDFINHFHKSSPTDEITKIFTEGCCYWFAHILHSRFPNSVIMYDPVINHFVTKIDERLYDITGDVTEQYNVISWDGYNDSIHKQRLIECCVNFTRE